MNKTKAVTDVLHMMRDSIGDEICRAFTEIEELGVAEADAESLLADQVLDILMGKFAEQSRNSISERRTPAPAATANNVRQQRDMALAVAQAINAAAAAQ